jgi:hypothetical protein
VLTLADLKLPGQDSNLDKESQNRIPPDSNPNVNNDLSAADASLTARLTADSDLARILTAWPTLPPHIRGGMLALISTAR